MSLHRNLTGSELHEPKGVDAAANDTVYVADGAGSGTWQDRYSGLYNKNLLTLTGVLDDVSTPSSHVYFVAPVKCEIVSLQAILDNAITVANSTITIYINGVAFADTLTVPFAGSTAGTIASRTATTASTISAGSLIEVRSDGGSTTAARTFVQLTLRAKA